MDGAQIVLSISRRCKAEWEPERPGAGRLDRGRVDHRRVFAFPIALLADRWSRVKEHRRHGGGVELSPPSPAASRAATASFWRRAPSSASAKRATARRAAHCSPACSRRRGGRRWSAASWRRPWSARCWAWRWAASSRRAGAGRRRSAWSVCRASCSPSLFLLVRDYRTVPLDRSRGAPAGRARRAARLLGPRTALLCYAGGALQLLTVSTIYVWLPSYLNRFHGLATDKAGLMTALVLVLGSVGIVLWGYVADRVGDSSPRRKLMVPAACLRRRRAAAVGGLRRHAARQPAVRRDRRRRLHDDGGFRHRSRRRHRRHPSRPARHRCRHGRRGAEPVRSRRRAADHRRAVRRLRPGDGTCRSCRCSASPRPPC